MKKKLAAFAIAGACALTCAFALVGCGKNANYYNKTYTLTGSLTADWSKSTRDIYTGETKDTTIKKVLEKHWNDIDWAKTAELNSAEESELPAHETLDGFIAAFDTFNETAIQEYEGLKISVSDKDTMTLTVTFPEQFSSIASVYGSTEITMPFAETQAQFDEISPYEDLDFGTYINAGYHGMGIYKASDTRFLVVEFGVDEYKDRISLSIVDYTIESYADSEDTYLSIEIIFNSGYYMSLCDAQGNMINVIECYAGFEVTKN